MAQTSASAVTPGPAMAGNLAAANLFSVPSMVAVVTGGGTGLGLMMARALASNGAYKGNIIPLVCDVTSKDALAATARHISAETGFINLLIANSGIAGPLLDKLPADPTLKQFQEYAWNWSSQEFTDTYNVNNTSVFFTVIAFLELLDAGNRRNNLDGVKSQVIIIASIASFLRKVFTGFAYVTSKAAAASMTKALATYLVPYQIRVNAVSPGFFPSEMTEEMLSRLQSSQGSAAPTFDRSFIPAERAGNDEDMGGTVLYMASRAGAYLDGCIIVMDGGRLSILPSSY